MLERKASKASSSGTEEMMVEEAACDWDRQLSVEYELFLTRLSSFHVYGVQSALRPHDKEA